MIGKRITVSIIFGLLLFVASCAPRGAEEAVPVEVGLPPTEPAQVMQAATSTPEDVDIITEPIEDDAEIDEVEEDIVAEDDVVKDAIDEDVELEESPLTETVGDAVTVEAALPIEAYRQRIHVMNYSGRGEAIIDMENEYIKDPPAQHSVVEIQEEDETYSFEYIYLDGTGYVRSDDTWVQSPDPAINIREVTLLMPEDVIGLTGEMEQVGEEEVEGRPAIHYRGTKDIIPTVDTAGDTLDPSQAETAQLDLWIDQEFDALTKLELTGTELSASQEVSFALSIVYYDLNGDISITAPEGVTSPGGEADASEEQPEAGNAAPLDEVSALLGFDIPLPTGSTVEMTVADTLVVVNTPYTVEEAATLVETLIPENGYELINQVGSVDDSLVYTFRQGETIITVTITTNGEDGTVIQFASQ